MIIQEHELQIQPDTKAYAGFEPSDCIFFDIETTGFSSRNSIVYLIGCVYYSDNNWRSIQWFADTPESERNVLLSFFAFANTFKTLINFNGDGFDIPFLRQRAEHFDIADQFSPIHSIDIFRALTPAKKFLKLLNYKQKSIESFLDISREDIYSGKELINVYMEYTDKPTEYNLGLLMLHNYDDICGLTKLLPILSYGEFASGSFVYDSYELTGNEIIFTCTLLQPLPKRVSLGFKDFYITACQNTMKLRVKIYSGELKFFYSNYKDYYYLPNEDMAIHKSVAFYVDKDFRTKAKAANCYSKKSGKFIPQFSEIVPTYFKIEFNDKLMYIELNDDFLQNKAILSKYIKDVIKAV